MFYNCSLLHVLQLFFVTCSTIGLHNMFYNCSWPLAKLIHKQVFVIWWDHLVVGRGERGEGRREGRGGHRGEAEWRERNGLENRREGEGKGEGRGEGVAIGLLHIKKDYRKSFPKNNIEINEACIFLSIHQKPNALWNRKNWKAMLTMPSSEVIFPLLKPQDKTTHSLP